MPMRLLSSLMVSTTLMESGTAGRAADVVDTAS